MDSTEPNPHPIDPGAMGISLAAGAAALTQPQVARNVRPPTPAELQILGEWLRQQSSTSVLAHGKAFDDLMQRARAAPPPKLISAAEVQRASGSDVAQYTTLNELMQRALAAPVANIIGAEDLKQCAPGYAMGLAAGLSFQRPVVGPSIADAVVGPSIPDEGTSIFRDLCSIAPKCPPGKLGLVCLAGFLVGSLLRASGLATHNENLRRFGQLTGQAISCGVDILHGELLATVLDGVNVFATFGSLVHPNQAFVFDTAMSATDIVGLVADNSGQFAATCQDAVQRLLVLAPQMRP